MWFLVVTEPRGNAVWTQHDVVDKRVNGYQRLVTEYRPISKESTHVRKSWRSINLQVVGSSNSGRSAAKFVNGELKNEAQSAEKLYKETRSKFLKNTKLRWALANVLSN